MPRSHTGLWPQLIAWDNLLRAYQRCRRRKRNSPAATAFDFAWETELLPLADDLASGRYVPGPYRHFWIHDPKPRKISAAPFRDRVVHHALVWSDPGDESADYPAGGWPCGGDPGVWPTELIGTWTPGSTPISVPEYPVPFRYTT